MIAGPDQVQWLTSFAGKPPGSWTAFARSANSCCRTRSPTRLVPTGGTLPTPLGFTKHSACSAPAYPESSAGSAGLPAWLEALPVTDLLLTSEK
jgi:hypothetical protein